METVWNKTEGKAKSKMGRRCEEWFEEDGGDQLETNDAGEEEMERNNWASQNSQRVVELKKKKRESQHPKFCLSRLIFYVSRSQTITDTHPIGLLWMRDQLVAQPATYTTRTSMPSVRFKPAFSTFWIGDWCCQDEALEHSRIEWGQLPLLGIYRMVSLTSRRLQKLSHCVMSFVTCHTSFNRTVYRSVYEGSCGFAVRMVLGFKQNCAPRFKWKRFRLFV